MMDNVLLIDGRRDAYSVAQLIEYENVITVGELIGILKGYNPDMKVILCNDNGYTYGAINEYSIEDSYEEVAEEEEEEEEDEEEDADN